MDPPVNADYYQVLGVDRNASPDDVKRAYRRMALRCHPDKAGADPAAAEQFRLVAQAQDTLLDPKRRRIYDRYGARGEEMARRLGELAPFVDPDVILLINWVFFAASLLAALLIVFPALVAARADNVVRWSWAAVFVPMFILDAVLFLGIARITLPRNTDDSDADSSRTRQDADDPPKKQSAADVVRKSAIMLYVSLFILFQVLIVLALDNAVAVSWAAVFVPYYLLECANFLMTTFVVMTDVQAGKTTYTTSGAEPVITQRPYSGRERLLIALLGYSAWTFRIVQMVVFILKLDNVIQASWALVFIPFYVEGFFKLAVLLAEYSDMRRTMKANPALQVQSTILIRIVSFFVVSGLFFLGLALLVSRLDNASGYPTAGVILIPTFVVLSILFCCVCCCLPCFAKQARNAVEAELMGENDGNGAINLNQIVPVNHRLL